MARTPQLPLLPPVRRMLAEIGANVRLARLRRRFSAQLVAERAGISAPTLRALERGDAGVSLGVLAGVLHALGLDRDLAAVARDDVLGRKLQDAELESARRVPRPAKGGRRGA